MSIPEIDLTRHERALAAESESEAREDRLQEEAERRVRDLLQSGQVAPVLDLMGPEWGAEIAADLALAEQGGPWQELLEAMADRIRGECD